MNINYDITLITIYPMCSCVKKPETTLTTSCTAILILHRHRLVLVDDVCSLNPSLMKSLKNLPLGSRRFHLKTNN